jgi:PIN domain nuclease of toxin-antitoxin system
MILVDSHVLAWFHLGQKGLGLSARRNIERIAGSGGVHVSSISFFELGYAASIGYLKGVSDVAAFRREVLGAGVVELPPDSQICLRAVDFRNALVDAFDAIIAATAEHKALTLVTADERILAWKGALKRLDARK